MSEPKAILEYGVTHDVHDDLKSSVELAQLEQMFTEDFRRHVDREGYDVYEQPVHQWLDRDDPKVSIFTREMEYVDEDTGETRTYLMPRWQVRSIGKVIER